MAGGNLGVTFSTGDITQGAFGTVTSVCDGLVRGFGHPFNLLGKTTYGLSGAETLYIQEDPVAPPFTVANFGPALGTITQDRYVGVSARSAVLPDRRATVTNVQPRPDLRTSQSVVTVQDALAQTTNYAIAAQPPACSMRSRPVPRCRADDHRPRRLGAVHAAWRQPLRRHLRHRGHRPVGPPGPGCGRWLVPDVTIDTVTAVSTVTDDPSTFALVRVEQRLDGHWVELNKDTPAHVKAGKKAALRPGRRRQRQRHRPAQPEHPEQGRRSEGPAVPQPGLPFPV